MLPPVSLHSRKVREIQTDALHLLGIKFSAFGFSVSDPDTTMNVLSGNGSAHLAWCLHAINPDSN